MRGIAFLCIGLALLAAGCGGNSTPQNVTAKPKTLFIAVDAPFSRDAYLGNTIVNGVELALQNQIITVGQDYYRLKVVRYDNAHSPSQAVANARRAIARHAVAIISDGTGVDATWRIANRAHIPICVVFDGGTGLVGAATRPNVFRIAPTNHGIAFRYAEYLIPKKLKLAFLTDDTGYGRAGLAALNHRRDVVVRADLAYDVAIRIAIEHRAQSDPCQRVVGDDEDPQRPDAGDRKYLDHRSGRGRISGTRTRRAHSSSNAPVHQRSARRNPPYRPIQPKHQGAAPDPDLLGLVPLQQIAEEIQSVPAQQIAERMQSAGGPGIGLGTL